MRTLFATLPLIIFSAAGCTEPEPAGSAVETPDRQFVLDVVRMEERRDGKLLWEARAKKLDGDLASSDAIDIELVRQPQREGGSVITMVAPRGKLDLDHGSADFETVEITDDAGGRITAVSAHYDEKDSQIDAAGPLHFTAKGLTAVATSGVVKLDEGAVYLEGPIVGRID